MNLYYDDALQAAWMAREFGVKFADGDSFDSAIEMAHQATLKPESGFYIHIDSVHIFKPNIGDIIWNDCDKPYSFTWGNDDGYTELPNIILRNGKQFFMPKDLTTDSQ